MSECGTTNFGGKFYISTTAENEVLNQAGFEALSYTEVPNMGTSGDTGYSQNIISYSTWSRTLVCKGKGEATANDPAVEFLDKASAGMDLMLSAADPLDQNNYAFYYEWADGSIEYLRGFVSGQTLMKGSNEDFKRISFTLGIQDVPIPVAAPSS